MQPRQHKPLQIFIFMCAQKLRIWKIIILFREIAKANSGAMRQLVGNRGAQGASVSLSIHTTGRNMVTREGINKKKLNKILDVLYPDPDHIELFSGPQVLEAAATNDIRWPQNRQIWMMIWLVD